MPPLDPAPFTPDGAVHGAWRYPLFDAMCDNTMLQFAGRVYASACGSHGTELLYINDTGVYMVQQHDGPCLRRIRERF
jgi:hypothetical protein